MAEGRQWRLLAAALLLGLASPSTARAETAAPAEAEAAAPVSAACDGAGRPGWMLRETILGISNPLGAVAETRVGYCAPLVRGEGVLARLSSIEAGFFNFLTPSFSRQGGYLRLVPISVLVLHVGLAGVWYWPLPGFRAAAYFDAPGYDFVWPSDGITNEVTVDKEHGGGLNVTVAATLRASLPIGRLPAGDVELIVLDNLALDYWLFPGHDHYYNQRADAVLASSDAMLSNTAVLLVGLPLSQAVGLRIGATDSLGYLPLPGRLATHQVGGLAMVPIVMDDPRIAELVPFFRVTTYTEHMTRDLSFNWNFLIGVDLSLRI